MPSLCVCSCVQLWTQTYSVEAGSRRKLQLATRNGTSVDMSTFREESAIPGLTYTPLSHKQGQPRGGRAQQHTGGGDPQPTSDCSGVPGAPHPAVLRGPGSPEEAAGQRGLNGELPPWMEKQPGRDGQGRGVPPAPMGTPPP